MMKSLREIISAAFARRSAPATSKVEPAPAPSEADQSRGIGVASPAAAGGPAPAEADQCPIWVAEFFGLKAADMEGKTEAELRAVFAKKLSDETINGVANRGLPASALPPLDSGNGRYSKTKSLAEFRQLTPAAKMDFSSSGGRLTD